MKKKVNADTKKAKDEYRPSNKGAHVISKF